MRPTIAEAFRRAIIRGRETSPEGLPVTMARVTSVFANGMVGVQASGKDVAGRGYAVFAVIPVAGEGLRTLRPGAQVAIGWQRRRPVVAIAHSAKRSGAPVPLPPLALGILEELIRAPITAAPADANRFDVWFRNAVNLVRLRCFELLGNVSVGVIRRAWGHGRDRFIVNMPSSIFVPGFGLVSFSRFPVFALDRDPDEVISDEPTATLLRLDDPTLSPLVLGDVTIKETLGSAPFTITTSVQLGTLLNPGYIVQVGSPPTTVEEIRGQIDDWYLDSAGDTILTVRVIVITNPATPFNYPVVVNLTKGTILFNALTPADRAAFGNPPNTLDGTDFDRSTYEDSGFFGQHMILPLAETEGQLVAVCAASTWIDITASSLFDARILPRPTGAPVVLVPQQVSGAPGVNTRFLWPITYNSRFLLWVNGVAPTNVSPMQTSVPTLLGTTTDDVKLTDFLGVPPAREPSTATVAQDLDAFLGRRPTLLTPDLLLFDPDSAEPFFVEFLGGPSGEAIVLNQQAAGFPELVPPPFDVAALLAEFDAETAFVLARLESFAKTAAGYASSRENVAWQVIPDPASRVDLPDESGGV